MRPEADRSQPELPCVWVTAGVLSYRPCGRDFDCEGCPLYLALRGGGGDAAAVAAGSAAREPEGRRGDVVVGRYLAELGAGCTLHLDRAYNSDGLWMEAEPSGDLRFGLDDYTGRLLQPVDDVVLPRLGVWLRHGAPCAWLNRGRLTISVRCPIAGEVVAVHPRPSVGPSGGGEPSGERWWFRIRPHEAAADAGAVYRNEALLSWYLGRVRAVHDQLDAVLAPSGGAAEPALADGGRVERNLERVLGRGRFEALVGALFPVQI